MPTYSKNRKAYHDFEILDTLEAGLALTGPEVKSVRNGQINLKGAFITFHKGSPMLTNASISKYAHATIPTYQPDRSRAILLHKKQIDYIRGKSQENGLTIVPLSVYTKGPLIKLEIGVAKGKKQYDKRRTIKEREGKRAIRRALKGNVD